MKTLSITCIRLTDIATLPPVVYTVKLLILFQYTDKPRTLGHPSSLDIFGASHAHSITEAFT
jgi:hypothetical protein